MWYDILGTIGACAFSIVSVPMLVDALRKKDANHISWLYLILSYIGNISVLSYIVIQNIETGNYQIPMWFNYIVATLMLICCTICKLHYARLYK